MWIATIELAAAWRESEYIQEYLRGARSALSFCRTSGQHIASQPFYLWRYLPTHMEYDRFARAEWVESWLGKCAQIEEAFTILIEWLRSRVEGYPFLGAPQLTRGSPWTAFNVSMETPWLIELRRMSLQSKKTPPTIPFLNTSSSVQMELGAQLGAAIAASPCAQRLGDSWRSLAEGDKELLRAACAAVRTSTYPEPADVTGAEDFRELAWAEAALDEAIRPLAGRAMEFVAALRAADGMFQQVAALFVQMIVYNEIRQLGYVNLVEQHDGGNGWHAVSSESTIADHVRQREIVGFDHPYPRGVMMVYGITERLGRRHQGTTVRGRILRESEALAALAGPAHTL